MSNGLVGILSQMESEKRDSFGVRGFTSLKKSSDFGRIVDVISGATFMRYLCLTAYYTNNRARLDIAIKESRSCRCTEQAFLWIEGARFIPIVRAVFLVEVSKSSLLKRAVGN